MFPELLERRTRETEAERDKFDLCLPAFFYNVPVFPGQTLCLHFFEPRYKLMMRRIINTSRRYNSCCCLRRTKRAPPPLEISDVPAMHRRVRPARDTRGRCRVQQAREAATPTGGMFRSWRITLPLTARPRHANGVNTPPSYACLPLSSNRPSWQIRLRSSRADFQPRRRRSRAPHCPGCSRGEFRRRNGHTHTHRVSGWF